MVTGYHFALASEEVDTYFARESERFARKVVFETPPVGNSKTTTYAEEICAAEEVIMDPSTQSILGVPSKTIRHAIREVDAVIENWMSPH
jgi:hypothetical protein